MSTINIGRDNADASYRYKMPKLVTKIEGRGNGIKTVIVNMTDIAKALHVDPAYPTKYFGIELGAQSKYNAKTERAIVNGCHNAADLAKMLEKFIEKFVLCPNCKLPEIKMEVKKNVKIDCAACGYNGIVPDNHRLVGYIIKDHNPTSASKTKDKKDKKKKKKAGSSDSESGDSSDREGLDGKDKDKDEDVEWFTDTSKEAQKLRKEAELAEIKGAKGEVPGKDTKQESPAGMLKLFLSTGGSGGRSSQEIVSEVKRLQLARGLDEPQKIKVLLEALIDTKNIATVPDQYKTWSKLFAKFASDRASAGVFIGCIEEQVGVVEPRLLKRVPLILQALYESDVLDEETILGWASSPPESSWLVNKDVAAKVRKAAKPFIDWLKNAEEEDEGDDE